ncbi:MAG: hypothetical protein JNK35_14375 [Phycisphaerae bacterium]|nr:hypothetical protein [Phycisphaerae bacterium]
MRTGTARVSMVAMVVACGLAAPVWGQAQATQPLQGPKVVDRDVPGTKGEFGTPQTDKRSREREIPHRAFMEALKRATGPDAAEGVRLSDAQREKILAIDAEHRSAMEAFLKANAAGADGDALRRAIRERAAKAEKGKKPGEGAMTGEEAAAMRERFEALREGAPKAGDARAKIWAELNEAQRSAVTARLEEFKARVQERMNEEYVQKRVKQKTGGGGEGVDAKGRPGAGGVDLPRARGERVPAEFRERLMGLVERMSPEQREMLIERLRERLGEKAGPSGVAGEGEEKSEKARRKAPKRGGDAPAKADPMKDVDVPGGE